MGCKQSKYALGDEGHGYMDGNDPFKGSPEEMDGMYPSGIQTDIIPAHRYVGDGPYPSSVQNSQKQLVPHQPEVASHGMCPSDAQFAQMAEGCTAGFLEMFSLGGNQKMITNGPDKISAYQQPAYNYQTPPSSEHSLGNHSGQAHSQSSQRRAVLVQNGSYSL